MKTVSWTMSRLVGAEPRFNESQHLTSIKHARSGNIKHRRRQTGVLRFNVTISEPIQTQIPARRKRTRAKRDFLSAGKHARQLIASLESTDADLPRLHAINAGVIRTFPSEITQISGSNLVKGSMFTVAGLYMVDRSGIQTKVPVQIIVKDVNAAGTVGQISPLRITLDGKGYNNPNAWVATGTTTLTLVDALGASKTYQICEVRMAYDTYQFDSLPGSDEEMVATVGGSSVKMRIFGDGTNLNKLIRLDSLYAAAIFEPRDAVVIYVEK